MSRNRHRKPGIAPDSNSKGDDGEKPTPSDNLTVGAVADDQHSGSDSIESLATQPGTQEPESPSADSEGAIFNETEIVTTQTEQTSGLKNHELPEVAIEQIQSPPPVQEVTTPPPEAPKVQASTAAVKETPQPAAPSGPTPWPEANRLLANVPPSHQTPVLFLIDYHRVMAPKRSIKEQEGAAMQVMLRDQIVNVINREDTYFKEVFGAMLRIFEAEAEGTFSATHAFRFMDSVRMNKDEARSFVNLVEMMRLLGPVKGRSAAAKQMDINRVLAKGLTDTGRQRVLSYFGDTIKA